MSKDKRIRLNQDEIDMIAKALKFYSENGGTPTEVELREKHSFMMANTLGLEYRFDTLALKGAPSRGRQRFIKWARDNKKGQFEA